MRKKARWAFGLGLFFLLLIAVLQASVFYRADFHPADIKVEADFETEMQKNETQLSVPPGANKAVVWQFTDHRRTPLSLVQIHGFSATRRETSPLPEELAQVMRANLFMTRLMGHGLGSSGMGSVTAAALLQDAEEAYSVGRVLGEKVVILATSTGSPLALSMASRHPEGIAAMIFMSPIYRPADPMALILKGPLGKWVSRQLPDHRWQAQSEEEKLYWTTSYPMTAVHELMNLLSWTNAIPTNSMKIPLLVFYTENDKVVSVELIKEHFQLYGGPKKIVEVSGADHVLAGDIKGPKFTEQILKTTEEFLRDQGVLRP